MSNQEEHRVSADPRRRTTVIRIIGFFLRPVLRLVTRRRWTGLEKVPAGGFVVAMNHISHLDPFTVSHFLYDQDISPRFLAKAGLFDLPVGGRILRATGQIPVYRNTATAADAFAAAVSAVEQGQCVIFYPEGTISKDPDLWPMRGKTGAARVALATGRPLVPVAQWGTNEILPPYTKRPHLWPRKTIWMAVGEPVDLSDLRDRPITPETARVATDRLMRDISALLSEVRGAAAPPTPYDPRSALERERESASEPDRSEPTHREEP